MALAVRVLGSLRMFCEIVQARFADYHRTFDPNAVNHARNPHIWIDRELLSEEGENRWTFVIERDDNPDFGYHVEFEESEFLEMWTAD